MSNNHAHWDDDTMSYFLDLCIEQKNLLHWNQRGLTKLGWNNVYRQLSDHIGPVYDNKQVQNKVNALKGKYMDWLKAQTSSVLMNLFT